MSSAEFRGDRCTTCNWSFRLGLHHRQQHHVISRLSNEPPPSGSKSSIRPFAYSSSPWCLQQKQRSDRKVDNVGPLREGSERRTLAECYSKVLSRAPKAGDPTLLTSSFVSSNHPTRKKSTSEKLYTCLRMYLSYLVFKKQKHVSGRLHIWKLCSLMGALTTVEIRIHT